MKKIFFFALALFVTANVFAQTAEEIQASKARLEKIEKLVTPPKPSGLAQIDKLTAKSGTIAVNSVEITPLLQNMCYRSAGQNNEGVADATVVKPNLGEAQELSVRIAAQTVLVKDAGELVKGAAEELQTIKNPLKLKAPSSCLSYSKDVLAIAGEESVFQAKAIAEIIKTLSDK